MEKQEIDLSSIHSVAFQLRVPELKYLANNDAEQNKRLDKFLIVSRLNPEGLNKQTVTKKVFSDFDDSPLSPQFNNLAFITDRFFDVWLRKNNVSPDINEVVGRWRFVFFEVLYRQQNEADFVTFIQLLEMLAADSIGWCPFPKRSRSILINQLGELEKTLFSASVINEKVLTKLLGHWQEFKLNQHQKWLKVTERLIEMEHKIARARYANALAQDYLNQKFSAQQIPQSLQVFLDDYWLELLSLAFQENLSTGLPATESEDFKKLTDQILMVFYGKDDEAFKLAGSLIDKISECFETRNWLTVPETICVELEQDIVRILQNKTANKKPYCPQSRHDNLCDFDADLDAGFENTLYSYVDQPQWFSTRVKGGEHRVQIAKVFEDSKQLLLCNHAGIKLEVISFGEFKQKCRSGEYKILSPDSLFSQVIKTTITGLLKVVSTQERVRAQTAEKVRKEAEQLVVEKEKAEQDARIKAAEIVERAKNIQLKHDEKRRLQKESEVYQALPNLKLGGWIGVKGEGEEHKSNVKRYKLAVKLAASGKYTFVDKFGIKKLQFTEDALVEGLVNDKIEILSQGAEFEDSLERVLSRMRMSK